MLRRRPAVRRQGALHRWRDMARTLGVRIRERPARKPSCRHTRPSASRASRATCRVCGTAPRPSPPAAFRRLSDALPFGDKVICASSVLPGLWRVTRPTSPVEWPGFSRRQVTRDTSSTAARRSALIRRIATGRDTRTVGRVGLPLGLRPRRSTRHHPAIRQVRNTDPIARPAIERAACCFGRPARRRASCRRPSERTVGVGRREPQMATFSPTNGHILAKMRAPA